MVQNAILPHIAVVYDGVMQTFKRILEWYFDISPAPSGQGTAWHLSAKPPWPSWMPQWAVLLAAVALAAYVVCVYLKDARLLPLRQRALLILLRLATICLVLAAFSELMLAVDRTGLPLIAVLVDDSASMGFEDRYSAAKTRRRINAMLGNRRSDHGTRLDLAKALLTGDGGRFLKQLSRHHKLRVYRFSGNATVLGRGEYIGDDEIDDVIPLLEGLTAHGEQTRPGPAVRTILNEFRGTPPTAIVILTDGVTTTTDADRLTSVAQAAKKRLVPILAVGIGSDRPARDLQLYDVLVDEVAFVGDPMMFSAKLRGDGLEDREVTVVLKQKDSGQVLASQRFPIGTEGQSQKVELTHTPSEEGEFDYVMEVTAIEDETTTANNGETRHVSVRHGKIRVLLADSVPRWEFRELKMLLEREAAIDLHTVLQDADIEYADQDRTAKPLGGGFPVRRDQILMYDVIIFGDVDPSYLNAEILENVRNFVREAGGGLILIAGPEYNPHAYAGTPLEIVLPVGWSPTGETSGSPAAAEPFRLELTLDGQKGTALFHFARTGQESTDIWKALPPLCWFFETSSVKPGARVFAVHPVRIGPEGKLPVIVMQQYGAGKVLFHATDELWRWRRLPQDSAYAQYWMQAIRYLSRSRLLGQTRTAELTADRVVYQHDETVTLRARFFSGQPAPADGGNVRVLVERPDAAPVSVELQQAPETPTVFEGNVPHLTEGTYHAWIAAPAFNEAPPSTSFRVEAPQRELQNRSLDRAELVQAAKLTHGRFYTMADAHQLPLHVPAGQPVPLESEDPILLWNRWELLLSIALLLLAEWLLRKRFRLI